LCVLKHFNNGNAVPTLSPLEMTPGLSLNYTKIIYLAYRLFGQPSTSAHFGQSARLTKRAASLTERAAHLANCASLTLTLT